MDQRALEIKVVSARDLFDVNFVTKMDPYVVVRLSGDSQNDQKQKTTVDIEGGKNPNWNFIMNFTVDELAAHNNNLTLVFTLRCQRNLGDKDIGEVSVPAKELLDSTGGGTSTQHVSYQIRTPSGKAQGVLNFSYKFSERNFGGQIPAVSKIDEPVMAYPDPVKKPDQLTYSGIYPPPPDVIPPPPPVVVNSVYPPQMGPLDPPYNGYPDPDYGYPDPGYGYPPPPLAPPPHEYGYPPHSLPPHEYGYPPYSPPPHEYGYPPRPPPPHAYPPQPADYRYGYTAPSRDYGYPPVQ